MGYKVLSVDEVDRLPPLTWLVHGILPQQSLSMLYAPPGYGKSFVALDLAHSIGLGNSWFANDTNQGTCVYVNAGEGTFGLKQRIHAWRQYNLTEIENVVYGLDPVYLHKPDSVRGFTREIAPLEPSLVVLDTLARCAVGADENSAEGIGPVLQGCDRIREETGAAVLVVHHATKPDRETGWYTYRGFTGIEAHMDTVMALRRDEGKPGRLVLTCDKQKDAIAFWPIRFKLETVHLSGDRQSAVPVLR